MRIDKVLRITKPNGEMAFYDCPDHCDFQFCEGFMRVSLNGMYGFIDVEGNEIGSFKYEDADDFCQGRAGVKRDGKWLFIDTDGNEICEPKYDDVESFWNGYARVEKNGKAGFIDYLSNEVGDICFDDVYSLVDGYVKVLIGRRFGRMDKSGFVEWDEYEFSAEIEFPLEWGD